MKNAAPVETLATSQAITLNPRSFLQVSCSLDTIFGSSKDLSRRLARIEPP
jgi:hypothetical protein